MRIKQSKIGDVEFEDDRIVTVAGGILGFSVLRRYVLLSPRQDSPFRWFLAVDRPELAFVVADPFAFFSGYEAPLDEKDLAELSFRQGDEIALLVIVTVRGRQRGETTFNLRAPIAVNMRTLLGKQVVLRDEKWGVRVPLPVIAPSPCGARVPGSAASR